MVRPTLFKLKCHPNAAAGILKGKKDASEFKGVGVGILFHKCGSDVFETGRDPCAQVEAVGVATHGYAYGLLTGRVRVRV